MSLGYTPEEPWEPYDTRPFEMAYYTTVPVGTPLSSGDQLGNSLGATRKRELTESQKQAAQRANETVWKTWEKDTRQKRPDNWKRAFRPGPPSRRITGTDPNKSTECCVRKVTHYKGTKPINRAFEDPENGFSKQNQFARLLQDMDATRAFELGIPI